MPWKHLILLTLPLWIVTGACLSLTARSVLHQGLVDVPGRTLAERLDETFRTFDGDRPGVAVGLGAGWVILSQVVAWRIQRRLGERDRVSKMHQLARQEAESLDQARVLLKGEHFDLCVVEAWRALEARLRQALLSRRVATRADDRISETGMEDRKKEGYF